MAAPTGGDAVVDVLDAAGVEVLFGITSVHNIPIFDAVARRSRPRSVTVRHEQAALGAADAYARVTGRLGVALTSSGPGAANAMGGLLEAYVAGSPVLHLTGQVDTRYLDAGRGFIHEVPDQPSMLRSLSKEVARATSVADIADVVAGAVAGALTAPQGPVSVEVPIDLQYAGTPPWSGRIDPPAPSPPDPGALLRAAEVVASSVRPLIWAGGGAVAAGAAAEVRLLAARLGAGVITSPNGRGVIPEGDPLCIGNLTWDRDVRALCAEADLLVAVGTRYQGPNTENWAMPLPATIVQIDVDPDRPGRNYPAGVAVRGDARAVLGLLLDVLDASPRSADPAWAARVAATAASARGRLCETLGGHLGLYQATERQLPPGTVVVKDSTIAAYTWGNRLLTVSEPRTSIMPNGFAIGLGVPHLIGAAVAAEAVGNRPPLLMVGDGGLLQSIGDLATLATEGLAAVVVCFNDGGYGILRNIQARQYGRTIGVDMGRPDLSAAAQALGLTAARVSTAEQYEAALADAFARAAPSLVEVDLDAFDPMAVPYTGTSKPPT